jgi:drug/metabolite transporter (DMT)-like permease
MIALAGVIVAAAAHLTLRWLGRTEDPRIVVFWFQVSVTVVMGVVLMLTQGAIALPPNHLWFPLLGIALCATLGQLALTRAYQVEQAATVAAASYIGPIYAIVGDVFFFDGWPSLQICVGGALVVLAGLFVSLRWETEERRLARGEVRDGLK